MEVPKVVLNSGHEMPVIGLGTGGDRPPNFASVLVDAIRIGYRHIDTASFYGSEDAVGAAVAEALQLGLIKSRDEVFITSKLWCTEADHDLVLPALRNTLERLGLDYVDLYLIHWPVRLKQGVQGFNFTSEDILPFDIQRTWEAMEECSKLGLAKSIGVSNFGTQKLTKLLQHATIRPAVNQVELNPTWQQQKLRRFCKENGIQVAAYSPLGANRASWGSLAVVENPILKKIAAAKGKSLVQVALRWIHEQGVVVVVKSLNKERMKQNLEIFDWKLTEHELALIEKEIPQRRAFPADIFVTPDGPYKSLDQLWDGDA